MLLFENGIFGNAPNVGNAIAAYYNQGGKCVVLGTFYWQDRSDNPNYNQPGWGALEAVDVFLADAGGSEYAPDSMDPNSIVAHPVTQGVTSLSAGSYRGGVSAKPGTTVLATWLTLNNLGKPDPVIGVREDPNGGKFVGISIFPDYESYGDYGVDFNGDFYKLWQNAFSWCTDVCGDGAMDPGEECDDGNVVSGDGCSAQCDDEFCGDGVDNDGDAEECDDGNAVDDDDCSNNCTIPGDTSTGTDSGAGTTDETTGDETTGDETTGSTTGDATTDSSTTGGTTTGTTGGDSNTGGASDSGTPTTGGGTTGGTTTGTTGDGSATGTDSDTAGAVDDGCGCSAATPEEGLRGGLLGLIGFGLLGRARRRRR